MIATTNAKESAVSDPVCTRSNPLKLSGKDDNSLDALDTLLPRPDVTSPKPILEMILGMAKGRDVIELIESVALDTMGRKDRPIASFSPSISSVSGR
mmetsp:Transcript_25451/g.45987  ORF Transcript_25451/g.45987 Transcript_25451/m.45987 type:complete len:97 (-) Transcript_25451:463-753(-)